MTTADIIIGAIVEFRDGKIDLEDCEAIIKSNLAALASELIALKKDNAELASISERQMNLLSGAAKPNVELTEGITSLRMRLSELDGIVKAQHVALVDLKAACCEVLIPSLNGAIRQGYKLETWLPEQMQWSKAVEQAEKALALKSEKPIKGGQR